MEAIYMIFTAINLEKVYNICIAVSSSLDEEHGPFVCFKSWIRLLTVQFEDTKAVQLLEYSGIATPYFFLWLLINKNGVVRDRASGPVVVTWHRCSIFRITVVRCQPVAECKQVEIQHVRVSMFHCAPVITCEGYFRCSFAAFKDGKAKSTHQVAADWAWAGTCSNLGN